MSKQLKLIINGITNKGRTKASSKIQSLGMSLPSIHFQGQHQEIQHLEDKLNKLNGNLNMLEKQYKSNLKQGFDCKIKAYRLQAAVQRRLLKHTIEQAQKNQFEQKIKEKIIQNQKQKQLQLFRLQMAKLQQEQKSKYIKARNLKQKRMMIITMQQKRNEYSHSVKKIHDQIMIQQSNINKKKDYFEYIKKQALKKDQFVQKKQILGKLVENNEKLKELKDTLFDMKASIVPRDNTFLTI